MAALIRRTVWAVLIAGCLCGRLAAQSNYVGDKAGKWTIYPQYKSGDYKEIGLSAADWGKFEAKFTALVSLVQNSKTFSQPMGFDAVAFSGYYFPKEFPPKVLPSVKVPLAFELEIYLSYYFLADDGYVYRVHGTETPATARITVNELTEALGADPFAGGSAPRNIRYLPDGRRIYYMPREIPLRVDGYKVYERPMGVAKHIFLTKGDRLPWVPITRQQFIEATILWWERSIADEVVGVAGIDPSDWTPEQAKKIADREKTDTVLKSYHAQLDRLTPEQLAAQAWYPPGPEPGKLWLVGPNDPQASRLVVVNPDFFDPSRPRTDFQIICVHVSSEPDFKLTKDEVPFWRLQEFLTTMDWQRVAELLD